MTGRSELWYTIWQSGQASTWLGTGFDAARGAIQDIFGIPYQAHNQYLSVLVELGYVWVALFTILFLYWIAIVARSGSVELWSIGLYVAAINVSNASMLTKTWMIFLTVMCLVNSFFPVGAWRRTALPVPADAHPRRPRAVRSAFWSRARVPPLRPAR
jgi:O-antigen ligase